jgi:LysM repeat protein
MRRVGLLLALGALCLTSTSKASQTSGEVRQVHQVYPGQTLGMIAKRYNVSVEELCAANGIQRRTPIKPKQVLVIPGADDSGASPAAPANGATRTAKAAQASSTVEGRSASSKKSSRSAQPAEQGARTAKRYARPGAKRGYLDVSSYTGSFRGYAVTRKGKVTDKARKAFTKVMASWRSGQREAIADRLIIALTRVSDHFGGRPVRIVSGYRPYSPTQYTPHSRHNLGHAVDFSIAGVPNSAIRDFCRGLGKVGVGYYPNSSFVHLDVRETPTYWVDYSGPGERPRYAHSRPSQRDLLPVSSASVAVARSAGEYPQPEPVDPARFELGRGRRDSSSSLRAGSQRTQPEPTQVPESF